MARNLYPDRVSRKSADPNATSMVDFLVQPLLSKCVIQFCEKLIITSLYEEEVNNEDTCQFKPISSYFLGEI